MKFDFLKYACIAMVAGFLVTGGPSYSAVGGGDLSVLDDLGFVDGAVDDELPLCGDGTRKCTKEQEDTEQKCKTAQGKHCTQLCKDGKWSKGKNCKDPVKTGAAAGAVGLNVF